LLFLYRGLSAEAGGEIPRFCSITMNELKKALS
jgi:hypothetical protein